MSLLEQCTQLETRLQDLIKKHRLLQQENQALQETKQFLKSQCEELFRKNDLAKRKVEQILGQLTKMEPEHD